MAGAIWWVIAPQYAGAVNTLQSLERISFTLVLVAGALDLASLAAYSALTASILGSGRPHFFTIVGIDLSGLAVNHLVPGGGATATAIEVTVSKLLLGVLFCFGSAPVVDVG
ncbi:hypothetical protein JOF48_003638 [Arthrobacter stackebrandtii]|uniref:Uncharacterized protein n=1 Tax=Arthrobacter stackebrandtii TaxID=272161 RepID=A0ABS4Z1L9_9MICC|nr:hypothetical protein [Arthrobacter stackebrandtii]MBP2414839.1 hypothetical protein [Arthrobacter stackebrandtii]PYG99495.1 hypothetical protein CVV67_15385 [Arthrobacter stackebrandtii]